MATLAAPLAVATRSPIPIKAWWILCLMTTDYVLGMIDRNAVSVLKPQLKAAFGLGDSQYSLLVTAFMIPYALFFVICGRVVDRYGTRGPFALFVGVWSVATIGAGAADSFPELVAWRAVLGAAEAGLLPATIYALVNWFPRDRLATVYAVKNPLQALGPILSPPLIAGITIALGWRYAFYVPGAIGLVFALLWWLSDRHPPDYGDQRNAPARSAGGAGFWALLRHPALLGLLAARLVTDPVWFFFQYWQAGYLQEVIGLSLKQVGELLWIPPLVNTVLMFGTALLSDRLIRRGWAPPRSRLTIIIASTVLAPLIAVIPFTRNVPLLIALITTTYVLSFTWLYLSNLLTADLFPKGQVASAVGVVSCVGTAGAALFNAAAGSFIESHGYLPLFLFMAALHPIGAIILWRVYGKLLRPGVSPRTG